jgi:hypothetical protein
MFRKTLCFAFLLVCVTTAFNARAAGPEGPAFPNATEGAPNAPGYNKPARRSALKPSPTPKVKGAAAFAGAGKMAPDAPGYNKPREPKSGE